MTVRPPKPPAPVAPRVRPGIMDIAPYVGGRSGLAGLKRVVKLSSNEGALGPSPRALDAYAAAGASLGRYPDGHAVALRDAIGRFAGLDPARIVCGAGSDELLSLLARAYAGEGDEVLYSAHGFLIYPIVALSVGARPVTAPENNLTADVDALLAAVTSRTRIVFLANPNNPTGSYLPRADLKRLRAGLPADVLLVIDAAYAEYVTAPDYTDGADLVDAGGGNVVMTRTFSKIWGLSSLRLGWAYGPATVIDVLNRLRPPFNATGPGQAAGIAALADVDHFRRSIDHNERWRAWLADALSALGLDVCPSAGNFLLVRFPAEAGRDAAAAEKALHARGLIPRRVDHYGLAGYLRITIGLENEMIALRDAVADFMKGRS